MRTLLQMLIVVGAISSAAYAQTAQSPYAGQEKRSGIKTLSKDEITAYQSGQGMGFAKAAELNQYPGPKHVIELASELKLSERQRAETEKIYQRMHEQATRLGGLIVAKEGDLDRLFISKKIDSEKLHAVVADIARLQGELRVVHLKAHLEMRRLLTPDQIKKYDELRGYNSNDEHKDHQHKN